eukprot:207511_1
MESPMDSSTNCRTLLKSRILSTNEWNTTCSRKRRSLTNFSVYWYTLVFNPKSRNESKSNSGGTERISMQRPSGLFLVVLLGLMTRVLGVSSRNLDDLEFQKSVNRIQSVKNNMKSLSGVSNPRLESWSGQNHCQFYFFIEGAQEVPAVTTMAMGSGRAGLTQDETALNYRFNFDCLSTTFESAHFHRAAAGTIGPVIFPLRPAVGKSGLAGREVGQWAMIEPDNVEALKNGEIYINIHSMMNPSGEIRGQLIPQNCN